MRRLLVGMSSLVIIGVLVVGCGLSGGDGAGTRTTVGPRYGSASTVAGTSGSTSGLRLRAKDFAFDPTALTMRAGRGTIIVTNTGAVPHNLTIKDLGVNTDLAPGRTVTVTVDATSGAHEFHCEYHPTKMTGTLSVR